MKQRFVFLVLAVIVLMSSASLSIAADNKADTSQVTANKAAAGPQNAKNKIDAKRKAASRIKLVDINGAGKKELMKLPGIGEADAEKIIAGRPYATKFHLVTHRILSAAAYQTLKGLVIAKQPYMDASKNAALYAHKK